MSGKHYTYILLTENNKLYCGYTIDPEKRFEAHKKGTASKFTRANKPLRFVYIKEFETKSEALKEEIRIKQLSRKQKEKIVRSSLVKVESPCQASRLQL